VTHEQRIWATVAAALFLLAILGGNWSLERQTNELKDDQHRSNCLILAGQQKSLQIMLDADRALAIDNRRVHQDRIAGALAAPLARAVVNAIPSLQDICGATADEILAAEEARANEGGSP
jgi:hypothetical protein